MNMLYKNKYQVRKKISTTEETSTSEDKEVSNEVSTFLEEILKINTDTSSTPSVSEQKDTIVKALAIYYEIKGKYPDSLKDLKDTPIYNPNTQQYESMTLDNIKLFETNFTYSKTATLYSLTQK